MRILSRLKEKIDEKKIARKIAEHPEAVAALTLVAQTTTNDTATTTTTVDLSPMVSIISSVIPLFVLVAVIKILFKSFKDVA
ncbi:hypothetical protein Pyrde_0090 [Pyrodictium delaneyi]|uniref:Uncharacterized protein n=1 Tax=Pyrodictium delaneyi TaxID=1273541 RepID=A0A0P0N1L0_9CREN|nr:hypothetical protein [Pyrodictium delaneyi]ALL00140.1 hypothetical protein Pyrde_0090 [Pyrodictium delaneyi]OWJ54230.1 hypothetical protein Pdsh_06990 [Pyrodictium delaneyi]